MEEGTKKPRNKQGWEVDLWEERYKNLFIGHRITPTSSQCGYYDEEGHNDTKP